jgi:hypothetical protein
MVLLVSVEVMVVNVIAVRYGLRGVGVMDERFLRVSPCGGMDWIDEGGKRLVKDKRESNRMLLGERGSLATC